MLALQKHSFAAFFIAVGAILGTGLCLRGKVEAASAQFSFEADSEIPASVLIQPQELVRQLQSKGKAPLILQIGSHVMYAEAHIPGSEYIGPAVQEAGMQRLRDRVHGLAKDQSIVIYCGCCPWKKCPNVRPAYKELAAQGFKNVKVLYIADNFGTDWVSRGYPVEKGR